MCTKTINNTNIKVEENKRKAIFKNPDRDTFDVSLIDGCLITNGIRTDYLVTKRGSCSVLVELKGTDVNHACKQIFTSVENSAVSKLLENKKGFLVVCTKYPRFDSIIVKAKQKSLKLYKAGFHVVSKQGEFDIERVVAIDGPY